MVQDSSRKGRVVRRKVRDDARGGGWEEAGRQALSEGASGG